MLWKPSKSIQEECPLNWNHVAPLQGPQQNAPSDKTPHKTPLIFDSTNKTSAAQALWELLNGIALPKMPKASTCGIPLVALHKAWALINSIINDTQLTSMVALLASKIDKLEDQMDLSRNATPSLCTHACMPLHLPKFTCHVTIHQSHQQLLREPSCPKYWSSTHTAKQSQKHIAYGYYQ